MPLHRTWVLVIIFQISITSQAIAGYREDAFKKFVDYMRAAFLASEKSKITELHQTFLNTTINQDKRIISLSLGVHYLEKNPKLALQYLTSAKHGSTPQDPLYAMILYYLGIAKLKQGNPTEALKISSEITSMEIPHSVRKLALVLGIEASYNMGRFETLHDLFETLASRYSLGRRLEHIAKKGVEALEKKGSYEEAEELTEDMARNYPNTDGSRWAFHRLLDLQCPKDNRKTYHPSFKFLVHLARNATPTNGLEHFVTSTLDRPIKLEDGSIKTLNSEERVDFLTQARLYKQALEEQEILYVNSKDKIDTNPDIVAQYLIQLGRLELKTDVPYLASSLFSKYIFDFPGHYLLPRATEYLADALRYAGYTKAAAETYSLALERKDSPLLRWFHFWTLYRAGSYVEALDVLDRPNFLSVREGDDPIVLIYWRGRILEKLGRKSEFEDAFRTILNHAGNTFYAAMVASRHPELISPQIKPDSSGNALNLSAKIVSKENQRISNVQENFRHIEFLQELINFGLNDIAAMQLQNIDWNKFSDSNSADTLSQLAYFVGDYNPNKRVRHGKLKSMLSIPRNYEEILDHQRKYKDDWKVFYPEAYEKIVFPVAKGIKLSPYLILSIMRAESFYNKDANSPVGAYGLMQLMPYTAVKIATLLKDNEFDMLDLGRPDINISYGAYYLDRLIRYYSGNPYVAVAAYNAGPKAVSQWVTSCRTCDPDEFVDSIPYRETRRYVREVMRNYIQYSRIYMEKPESLPLSTMPERLPDEEIF